MRLFIPERLHADQIGMERELRQYEFYRNINLLRSKLKGNESDKGNERERETSEDRLESNIKVGKENFESNPLNSLSLSLSKDSISQHSSFLDSNDYVQSYYRNLLEFGNAEVNANLYNYQAKQNKDSTLSKSL